nr:hypothetical protein [Tanacetum cinerariifolium]
MQLMELMALCTPLSDRVLALDNKKTAQDLEITHLKKRVNRLEKKRKSRTPQLKRRLFKDVETQGRYGHDIEVNTDSTSITTASINLTATEPVTTVSAPVTTIGVSVSIAEPSTSPTTTTLIKNEDLLIAQTFMKMRSVKSKEKSMEKGVSSTRLTRGMIMKEASETASRTIVPPQQQLDPKYKGKGIMQEPEKPVKVKGKDQIALDEEDNTLAMMEADYELAQRLQAEEQGELTIEERSKLCVELMDKRKKHFAKLKAEEIRIKTPTKAQRGIKCSGKKAERSGREAVSKKRTKEEFDQESFKRQKTSKSLELTKEPRDKEADELSQEELQQMMIISLVKEKFNSTEPTYDKEREIWLELKRLLKPDTNDELWKLQKHIHDLTWRLYDLCGVHHVSIEKGIYIYMLVEKEYPLSRGTLTLMLVAKLLVDQDNKMSRELLRKIFMQAERPRR